MITTTLNAIRAERPCTDGWYKLLRRLDKTAPDDEPLPLVTILDSNGIDDALWCLRTVDGYEKEKRLFAVWCARQVQHLTSDPSVEALDVAERFAHGEASTAELTAANYAAWAAADGEASTAELTAANYAAWAAARAARAAADAAARAAARAAWATANEDASQPSRAAAYAAAYAAAQAAQIEKFKEILG